MLQIANIEFSELNIPFNMTFSHASASRNVTQSIWLKVTTTNGLIGYGEGCPREYVTGESIGSAMHFINLYKKSVMEFIHDLDSLRLWIEKNEAIIDKNPAAFCAIELALLDVTAQHENLSIEALLEIPIKKEIFTYTAVLGNSPLPNFHTQLNQYQKMGLDDFKVKLSGNYSDDKSRLTLLVGSEAHPRIRVDANNLWNKKEDVINYMQALNLPISAIEEPMAPEQYDDLRDIAFELGIPVILDESLRNRSQITLVQNNPNFWILNIRVSKMGGLLRSLNIVHEAQRLGIAIIVGAHVGETSLLTRAGLVVAQAANDFLFAQEGAFGTYLLKCDVCDEPLQFRQKGKLSYDVVKNPNSGFGLAVNDIWK